MGYVIPFSFYQYKDYQNRVGNKKQDPYFIERPYQAILNSSHKNIEKQEDLFSKYHKPAAELHFPKQKRSSLNASKIYSEVTGKGQHINESI